MTKFLLKTDKEFQLYERLQKYADLNGYIINTDKKLVYNLIQGLIRNQIKFDNAYCPCRISRINENICPCVSSKDEINRKGYCKCKLFYKKESTKEIS